MAQRGAFGDLRVELRRGKILKMSPKHLPHALVQEALIFALAAAIRQAGLGWRVLVEASVSAGEGFDPMPDIVVIDMSLVTNPKGTINLEAVKLIIEVADSSLADDLGEKRDDYAAFGIAEYWVADVNAKTVHLHAQPSNGVYAVSKTIKLSDPLPMLTHPAIVAKI